MAFHSRVAAQAVVVDAVQQPPAEAEPAPQNGDDKASDIPEDVPKDTEDEAPAAPEPEGPATVTNTAGDSIHAENDVHVTKTGDSFHVEGDQQFNRITIDQIRIEHSTEMRKQFGEASNRESPKLEATDLISPPESEAHFQALEEHRMLVLVSTERTGLSTAVKQRCTSFAERRGEDARMLLATAEDELHAELASVEERTVLLLDLSHNRVLANELPSLKDKILDTLGQKKCHLVIAVEHESRHRFKELREFSGSVFELQRIPPDRIFNRYFDRPKTDFPDVRESPYFKHTLKDAWPPLARAMAEVLSEAPADLTVDDFRRELRKRLGDSTDTLRKLFENPLVDPQGKAVLIAAAALERLPSEAIAAAADDFLRETESKDPETMLLDEPGITQKLELIRDDFNLHGSNFKDPDLGDEVLGHVWAQYPSWHDPLLRWLRQLLLGREYFEWTDQTRLPLRIVKLASAAKDGAMLTAYVETMLASRSQVIRSSAPAVLLGGALDEEIGVSVRYRLYEWSRSADFRKQVAALTVCADKDYLVRFPSNALYRLGRLLGSENPSIRGTAFEATVNAAAHMHLSELLIHFHFSLIRSASDGTSRIPELLDQICVKSEIIEGVRREPWRLLSDPLGLTTSFWRLLLALADPASARLAVRAWLSVAAEIAPHDGDRMVELMVRAVANDYGLIGQVAQSAKSLALDGSDLSERTRELSRQMLNHVFEIEVPLRWTHS
ncbi:hypothetical protein [Glycomyces rhizosphaerae]|uniref:KAP family P-loop domain-containing protein n=1 Tax=Glycomyces rhizosphaerae TaxID=2054422 RepID=A0ABV7PUH9_9ACTN